MAKNGQKIDELYISLGLDIAKLQLDFDTAGRTVSNAIAQLNSSSNKIKLKMETDLSNLEGVGSELDKIKVKQEAVNRQLDIMRQKESILAAVLKDAQKNTGLDSGATRKAETDLLRQQKLVAQTEAELRKLAAARISAQGKIQIDVDTQKVKIAEQNIRDSLARMTAKIQNIRLKAEFDISSLRGVNAEFEKEKITVQALNKELELQKQKLNQLQNAYNLVNKNYGSNNVVTLNAQGNVLRQMQEINQLQAKIRELSNAKIEIKAGLNIEEVRRAENAINDSISRMNAKIQNIRVKAELDLSALKSGASDAEKNKIAVAALNKELDLQRQKLNQLQNAYRLAQNSGGKGSIGAINANTDVLRQQQLIRRLEGDIRNLNSTTAKVGANTSGFSKISSAVSGTHAKIGELVNKINTFNAAIATGATTAAAAAGFFKLSENAVKAGHDTYKLAERLHTSTAEAGALKRAFGMVNMDVSAAISIFARLGKQLATAGKDGNALTNAMSDYGFTLTDGAGKMLPYTKMLDELAKGYRNAQESGETAAFVADVLGARGTALEPLLADYEALSAASKDVKTTGLLDPQKAEESYRELKKFEFEINQLKSVTGATLLPITRELMPEFVGGFRSIVGMINQNKEGIKSFGELAGDVFGGTARGIMTVVTALGNLKKSLGETLGSSESEKILKTAGLEEYVNKGNTVGTILGGMIGSRGGAAGIIGGGAVGSEVGGGIYSLVGKLGLKATGEWDYYKEKAALIEQEKKTQEDLLKIRKELGGDWDEGNFSERQKRVAEVQKRLESELAKATSERLQEKLEGIRESTEVSIAAGKAESSAWKAAEREITKAIKDARAEAEKANEELKESIFKLTHTDFENRLDSINTNAENMLNRGADADLVLQEKELQLKKARDEFNRDVLDKSYETYMTEHEKRLNAIDNEKLAWIRKGLDEVSAVEWAENEKSKVIREFNNNVAANLDSIWQTELEKRLTNIEREKQAWIDKGVEEVKATQWAEQAKVDAQRNAAMSVLKSQLDEYRAFQRGGFEGLQDYQMQQLFKSGIRPEDLRITPEELAQFQFNREISQKSLLPNFMSQEDIDALNKLRSVQIDSMRKDAEEEKLKILRGISFADAEAQKNFENYRQNYFEKLNPNDSAEMSKLVEMSGKLADLSSVITKINLPQPVIQTTENLNRQMPPEVNVNVQIDEAHAWDTQHIQELAEKVADEITPAVVGAIGGDSNSY